MFFSLSINARSKLGFGKREGDDIVKCSPQILFQSNVKFEEEEE